MTGAASTAAANASAAAGMAGTAAGASTGILGTGIGAGVTAGGVATGVGTLATAATLAKGEDPVTQTRSKDVKTGVGEDVAFKSKKRRSVASTVQGGGLKRNSLG